jgi:hypothetical protein
MQRTVTSREACLQEVKDALHDAVRARYLLSGDVRQRHNEKVLKELQIDSRDIATPADFMATVKNAERILALSGGVRTEADRCQRLKDAVQFDSHGISTDIDIDLRLLANVPLAQTVVGLETELLRILPLSTRVSKSAANLAQKRKANALSAQDRTTRQSPANGSQNSYFSTPYLEENFGPKRDCGKCGGKGVTHRLERCTGPSNRPKRQKTGQGFAAEVQNAQPDTVVYGLRTSAREYACAVETTPDMTSLEQAEERKNLAIAEFDRLSQLSFIDSDMPMLEECSPSPEDVVTEITYHGLPRLDTAMEAKKDTSPPLFSPMDVDHREGYKYLRLTELELSKSQGMAAGSSSK